MNISLLISALALVGIGITIGMVRGLYITKSEHKDVCAAASAITQKEIDELQRNREEVWTKIDQIYEWMVTGVVKINRRDGK